MEQLLEHGFEGMGAAIQVLLNEAMKIERSAFLRAAPYERSAQRRGQANGYRRKDMRTRLGELKLQVPRVRGETAEGERFYPSALERGLRSERALKLAVAEMYVQGVSTRKVKEITSELCGLEVSSSDVSRAARLLDEELEKWRNRELSEVPYMLLDARYEKVRHGGSVLSCAVLWAVGVLPDGKRSVLGVSVSLSEAEVHWRTFLEGLQERGLHGVQFITSDNHSGLRAALKARFCGVPWQRCQFHLQQNAQAYIPHVAMRPEVARDLRSVFNATEREAADSRLALVLKKYAKSAPKLSQWIEENIPEGLTVLQLPPSHQRRMRTTNLMERINREIRRRTRVATLFPNEDSLLRLVSAILVELSEEWETGRVYCKMEAN
jgi:transposase-like protein